VHTASPNLRWTCDNAHDFQRARSNPRAAAPRLGLEFEEDNAFLGDQPPTEICDHV